MLRFPLIVKPARSDASIGIGTKSLVRDWDDLTKRVREIRKEFGHRDDVVFIGHRNERANRRRYPHHRPCSTSIIGFQTGELVLERHGSLDGDLLARVAAKHGLGLSVVAHERLPVRRYRRPLPIARRARALAL